MEFGTVQYCCVDVFVNERFAATVYAAVDPMFTEGIICSSFSNGEHDIYIEITEPDVEKVLFWVKQHLKLRTEDKIVLT